MCGLHGATELGVIGGMWDTDTRRDEIMERYGIDVKERESNLLAYHTRKGM